jgi:hypothetical protein
MVLSGILNAVYQILTWLAGFLPTANLGAFTWVSSAQRWIGSALMLNAAFPITEMLAAIGIYGTVYLGLNTGGVLRKIYSMFTGGGGA